MSSAMRMMWAALGTAVVAAAGPALAAVPVETQAAYAAAQTWSVQPAVADGADGRTSWEFALAPGESVDDFAQVNNFGDQPLTFRVYSQDATNTPGGAFTLQPADVEPVEVGAWIGLSEQVTIAPGEHAIVPFTLTVPADATPGDHAGGIVASIMSQGTNAEGQQVVVDNRVGSRVYLRVDGALAPQLQIVGREATYDRSWVPFSAGDVTATFEIRNTGNVRLSGEQTVTGQGLFGLGKHTMTLGDLPEILPGESVVVTAQIEDVAPLLRVTEQLVVNPRPPQATAEMTPPAQATATLSVWTVPWPELGILALLGLGGWWAWWQRQRRQRRTAAMLDEAVTKAREEVRRELQQKPGGAGQAPT